MKKNHKIIIAFFGICMILVTFSIVVMDQTGLFHLKNDNGLESEDLTVNGNETDYGEQAENGTESEAIDIYETEELSDTSSEKDMFYVSEITDEIKERITGISYPEDDSNIVISYEELSYVHVLYYDFEDQINEGELICNKVIATDILEIFESLYEAKYQIERIKLIDEFAGDDEASMEANNTSCFNYRVVPGTTKISNHAYGLAVDINPFYNPYITTRNGQELIQPTGSEMYCDRSQEFDHMITHEDLAYQLFIEHGFTWGGDWKKSKDYQHFEYKIPVE